MAVSPLGRRGHKNTRSVLASLLHPDPLSECVTEFDENCTNEEALFSIMDKDCDGQVSPRLLDVLEEVESHTERATADLPSL